MIWIQWLITLAGLVFFVFLFYPKGSWFKKGFFLYLLMFLGWIVWSMNFDIGYFRDAYDQYKYSNIAYAKNIETHWFLLTERELKDFLKDTNKLPENADFLETGKQKVKYSVVLLKNNGDQMAWGYLSGIYFRKLAPHMNTYAIDIEPIGSTWITHSRKLFWQFLYTKPVKKLSHVK